MFSPQSIGAATVDGLAYIGGLTRLCGNAVVALFKDMFSPRRLAYGRAVHQAMAVGVGALPILSLISFFIGTILALQSAYELRKFGALQFVASAVAICPAPRKPTLSVCPAADIFTFQQFLLVDRTR